MERSTICSSIEKQITEAIEANNFAIFGDLFYYPISFMGKDGLAGVVKTKVVSLKCSGSLGDADEKEHIVGEDDHDSPPSSDGKREG